MVSHPIRDGLPFPKEIVPCVMVRFQVVLVSSLHPLNALAGTNTESAIIITVAVATEMEFHLTSAL